MRCTHTRKLHVYKTEDPIEVPCGKCMPCRIQRTGEWTTRLTLESFKHKESCFITLTYSDAFLPSDYGLHKYHLQKFIKRLRFFLGKRKVKHYSVGEYGDKTGRPHYHLLCFGWYPADIYVYMFKGKTKVFSSSELDNLWPYGANTVGVVEPRSINYVTGYIRKKLYGRKGLEVYGLRQPPFQLSSQNLGVTYAFENRQKIIDDSGIILQGKNLGIPRYFFNKLMLGEEFKIKRLKELSLRMDKHREERGIGLMENIREFKDDAVQREKDLLSKDKLFGGSKIL